MIERPLNILVGCESSAVIRDTFRAMGHNAYSCDLHPCEGDPRWHYQCDVRELLTPGVWDLFICHPDCTYLTNSAAWAYKDGPYHQQVKPGTLVGAARRAARDEALDFVREMMAAPVEYIAIENPVGCISTNIDARAYGFSAKGASQYIQPYQYMEDASKKTGLWLKNLPPLEPTGHFPPRWVCCGLTLPDAVGKYKCPNCEGDRTPVPRWGNQTNSGQNNLSPGDDRWRDRSRTYQGWANAMAEQWVKWIIARGLPG